MSGWLFTQISYQATKVELKHFKFCGALLFSVAVLKSKSSLYADIVLFLAVVQRGQACYAPAQQNLHTAYTLVAADWEGLHRL